MERSVGSSPHRLYAQRIHFVRYGRFPVSSNQNLKSIRDASAAYQTSLVKERAGYPMEPPALYKPGNLVIFQVNSSVALPHKLDSPFLDPYQVLVHVKNDVECRHLASHTIVKLHVSRLKPFLGSMDEALKLALLERDQYVIQAYLGHLCDQYAGGSILWKSYDNYLFHTVPYEDYCKSRAYLYPLLFTVKAATSAFSGIRKDPITAVEPGVGIFVNYATGVSCGMKSLDCLILTVSLVSSLWNVLIGLVLAVVLVLVSPAFCFEKLLLLTRMMYFALLLSMTLILRIRSL